IWSNSQRFCQITHRVSAHVIVMSWWHCFEPSVPYIRSNSVAGKKTCAFPTGDLLAAGRPARGQEHERKGTERSGRIPEPPAQEQDARHHLPCERRQTAGYRHLVRQLLGAAAP